MSHQSGALSDDGSLPRRPSASLRLVVDPPPIGRRELRLADMFVASGALVVAALPMAVIAAAVRLSTPGPVLFRQMRVGERGQPFEVYKFRTMREGTDAEVRRDPELHAQYVANGFKLRADDARITRVGRVLRKTSLDELPQLINVLRGEMGIVGVRPLVADELSRRPKRDQQLYVRHRPGMTGLWQVTGRSTMGSVDRLALDRRYLETRSYLNDLRILMRTPFALVRIGRAH